MYHLAASYPACLHDITHTFDVMNRRIYADFKLVQSTQLVMQCVIVASLFLFKRILPETSYRRNVNIENKHPLIPGDRQNSLDRESNAQSISKSYRPVSKNVIFRGSGSSTPLINLGEMQSRTVSSSKQDTHYKPISRQQQPAPINVPSVINGAFSSRLGLLFAFAV